MGVAVQGGAVTVWDLVGSPKIQAGRESRSATREVHLAWGDIDTLIAELFPPAPFTPGAYPGVAFLYADSCSIDPFHPDGDFASCAGGVATYNFAKATISYSRLPYDASASQLISRKYSVGGEYLTIPAGTLYWEDSGDPVQEEEASAAKLIPTIEHSITWHRVPTSSIPWTAIKENIGKVNESTLNSDFFTNVAAETLLYLGAELNFTLSTDGTLVWTVEQRFTERKVKARGNNEYTWNHFLRPSDSKWMTLIDDGGNHVYPTSADFDDLFS